MMEYKGYLPQVVYDDEAKVFHGDIIGIKDVITFEGNSVAELEQAFRDSVDDYLLFCKERGESSERASLSNDNQPNAQTLKALEETDQGDGLVPVKCLHELFERLDL